MPASPNQPNSPGAVSRRAFFKGAGASAATAVLLDSTLAGMAEAQEAQARQAEAPVLGPGAVPVTLKINGQQRQLQIEPRQTLADVLRVDLDLTGTKVVCDRGSCSACTVFLDGTPVCSCMTLAIDAVGREIKTIEGVATGETLHPVQQAFIDHDAMQCGFCTPGMVMSCVALLERNPSPSEADVKHAIRGNLCRCGTYPNVCAATLAAAKGVVPSASINGNERKGG